MRPSRVKLVYKAKNVARNEREMQDGVQALHNMAPSEIKKRKANTRVHNGHNHVFISIIVGLIAQNNLKKTKSGRLLLKKQKGKTRCHKCKAPLKLFPPVKQPIIHKTTKFPITPLMSPTTK